MKKKTYAKRVFWVCSVAAALALAPFVYGSSGGGHGSGEAAKSLTAEETIKAVIDGNDQYRSHHDSGYFESYQKGQTPSLTVLTCADSRVHTELFGMETPNNNIFIIRNIGNQIINSEGSVDYGVHHLPTRILLVMGHSSCGAIKAAMGDYSGETKGIKSELDTLKPVMALDDGTEDVGRRWAKNVEVNVDYQVNYALQLYKDEVGSGRLAIVGGVYDFNDNYGKGRGTLVITNINGEADPNKIMNDPVLREVAKSATVNHVSSLAPAPSF
jgi:carbonic anhydrase